MQADIAVNIADLVAGTVHASTSSTGNFSFDTSLQTQGKLGSALGGASARVSFRHGATDSFSFAAAVSNVMKIPGNFTLSGDISSGVANAKAGCGSLGVGIGVHFNFEYTAPATFSLSVSLSLDFGVYTWNPTVFSA